MDPEEVDLAEVEHAEVDRAEPGRIAVGRADVRGADVGRADVGRADVGRADVGRADVGRAGSRSRRRSEVTVPAQPDDLDRGGHDWLDKDAGPVVRPYTMTGGRARPVTGGLDLLTYVEALYAPEADLVHLQPEHRSILAMTRTALSVAEIAAHLDLPVGVVRVLIGDLLQASLVSTFSSGTSVHPPDENILQAVIDGLRAL